MKCPLKFSRYEFEGGTECIGAECGFHGSVCRSVDTAMKDAHSKAQSKTEPILTEQSESLSDESDSREKLEADVYNHIAISITPNKDNDGVLAPYATVLEWLDRQAAIAERECLVQSVQGADAILTAENAELQAKVDELTAELEERKKAMVVLGKKYRDKTVSRDHWAKVAGRHANTIEKLKRQLKAERELAPMWPRYEDGMPVKLEDKVAHYYDGKPVVVHAIDFDRNGFKLYMSNQFPALDRRPYGTLVKRPPLMAADGKPIEVGQMVYGGDGRAWVVEDLNFLDRKYPVVATCDGEEKALKPEWLTHDRDGGLA